MEISVLLMLAEAGIFLLLAWALVIRPSRGRLVASGLSLALLVTTAVAVRGADQRDRLASQMDLEAEIPIQGEEAGFVASTACRSCHPSEYASWHRTFHRTMTQAATPESVVAPFEGLTLHSRGRSYRLERRGEEFWVDMIDPDWERVNRLRGADLRGVENPPRAERRVVMVTGSHHMQTYWVESEFGRELINLPFVYLFEARRWVPREDVFLRPPDAPPFLDLWNDNCIECHTTVGVPGLTEEAEAFETRTAELGIACEACHGPAAEHVAANRNPLRRYRLHLTDAADPSIVQPARLEAKAASAVCGQCHGVSLSDARDWLAQGHAYRAGEELEAHRLMVLPAKNGDHPRLQRLVQEEPQALDARFWSDGQVRVSGREWTGMAESPCYERGELSCLSCHSMHASDPNDQLAAGMGGDGACLQCHGAFAEDLEAHTHHRAGSTGSRCYNCHMPHTSYGLMTAMRSHTIDSPTLAVTVATERPNACNLCHLDRTLEWTGEHLNRWYGQPREALEALSEDQRRVSAVVLDVLEGDAGQRALAAWALGWPPALEASGGDVWTSPFLGHLLADPYATVRYIAQRSLRRQGPYRNFEYDYIGAPADRARARDRAIRHWLAQPWRSDFPWGAPILIAPDGTLDVDTLGRLSARRDDRPIALGE
jgi:predicted CXXCH cytochrome family protein